MGCSLFVLELTYLVYVLMWEVNPRCASHSHPMPIGATFIGNSFLVAGGVAFRSVHPSTPQIPKTLSKMKLDQVEGKIHELIFLQSVNSHRATAEVTCSPTRHWKCP